MKFFKEKLMGPYIIVLTIGALGFFLDFQVIKSAVADLKKDASYAKKTHGLICVLAIELVKDKDKLKEFCIRR